ncbi:hypothetical protein BD324DRAFT_630071 [Kockovaella imperatae]|uniref:Uncharacterized protein n=1 Tax=Kockovaella imperatae TaxID=4999 RepID=A0A1Y1UEW1_9TREE|nr:hypothetical protein BD324DRAFT_630071 [Kockovaella imperatae]ORX36077.1 hypothetical protein BD324DRAFT_630071 [Kockovaella imperatae]
MHSAQISQDDLESERQLAWNSIAVMVRLCKNVESIEFSLGIGLGEEIWRAIAKLDRLTALSILTPPIHPADNSGRKSQGPRLSPSLQLNPQTHRSESTAEAPKVVGEGGWTLGSGWDDLEILQLANLSQNATKTLATHFHLLSHQCVIQRLYVSTHFLDWPLCDAITHISAKLHSLELSTTGTKFTGQCLRTIIEGCQNLRSLYLDDIEGRLEKDTWSTISTWPPYLRWIEILISDSSMHHSWVVNHLQSIHCIPFNQLEGFLITRMPHPIARLPFLPQGVAIHSPAICPEILPNALLNAIMEHGQCLQELCLDWWVMNREQLDALVRSTSLKVLRVSVQMSMHDVIAMSAGFACSPTLEELYVESAPEFNIVGAPTKSLAYDYSSYALPSELVAKLKEPDSALPDSRELRKFVRKLPKLGLLSWTGRQGKGDWTFAKKGSLVNVSFLHAAIKTLPTWKACQSTSPIYPFDEVPVNPAAPAFLMQPVKAISPIDFPPLTRSSTVDSALNIPQTPTSKPGSVIPIVPDPTPEHFGRLVISDSKSSPNVRRLDLSKDSKTPSGQSRRAVSEGPIVHGAPPRLPSTFKAPVKSAVTPPIRARHRHTSGKAAVSRVRTGSDAVNDVSPKAALVEESVKYAPARRASQVVKDGWTLVGSARKSS